MRRRSLRFGSVAGLPVVAAAVGVLAWGCGGEGSAAPAIDAAAAGAAAEPGTIVVASTIDMRNVNELTADATTLHTAIHYFLLFMTLLEEQPDFHLGPPTFTPKLAKSYEFSGDRKTLTFQLRDDVVWSDGEPVTAQDVRWTWQAQVHPDVAWGLADYKRHIRDVEVVDLHTVRFHFDKVFPTQLVAANLGVILPRHAWGRLPFSEWRTNADWFRENLVVDGPFTLEAWEPGQRMVFRRNERYYRPGFPRAERIVLRVSPDRSSQLALLRSGAAHTIDWARPADAKDLMKDPEIEIRKFIQRGVYGVVWNVSDPLFADRDVRRALTLAIDRQSIIDSLYYGFANVSGSPYPSNLWVFNQDLEPWPHDPRRARELLAAAGWSDADGDGVLDRGGKRFSFEIMTVAGNELRQDILVMVQDQLARIGVEVSQRPVEFNTFLGQARSHEFAAAFSSLGLGTDLDLTSYFHSKAIDGGYNLGVYSNPEVDRVLDEVMARMMDPQEAKPLYDRLQVLLREDLPLTPLYEAYLLIPVRKELRGIAPNALSTFFGVEQWELVDRRP
ncbi:MAG TPA: ABC transporter substrate-binding protein [Thermoanaerobaculia bacterium]